MKQALLPLFLLFCSIHLLSAQSILNGSFETTTAPLACNYNLSNATFNSYMSDVNAYGAGQELDIIRASCFNPSVPDGSRMVGVADSPSDEIAMTVSPALVAGLSYTITFWSYAELSFRPRGDIQVGASTSNSAFGTLIFTGATVGSTWVQHSFTFTAPNNTTHITVRNITDGVIHWNHVDDFRLTVLLPVHIQKFEAQLIEDKVKLNWATESELNNDYFIVERSLDGIEWQQIGTLSGAGTSTQQHNYQHIDPNPIVGLNYYRLQQVDFDKNIQYSNIVAIEYNKETAEQVQVYPNPSSGQINIRVSDQTKLKYLSVVDVLGQEVYSAQSATNSIDLSPLTAGIYWIKIQLQDGRAYTKKIVLE